MKLKIEETVYLQSYDVAQILRDIVYYPGAIVKEALHNNRAMLYDAAANWYQFKYPFKDDENVKWLMEQEWIVDYSIYGKKSLPELKKLYRKAKTGYLDEKEKYSSLNKDYRSEQYFKANHKFQQKYHEIVSLENLIDARQHNIPFTMPDGTEEATIAPEKKGLISRLKK